MNAKEFLDLLKQFLEEYPDWHEAIKITNIAIQKIEIEKDNSLANRLGLVAVKEPEPIKEREREPEPEPIEEKPIEQPKRYGSESAIKKLLELKKQAAERHG